MKRGVLLCVRGACAALIGPFLPWIYVADYTAQTDVYGRTVARLSVVGFTEGVGLPAGAAVCLLGATAIVLALVGGNQEDPRWRAGVSVSAGLILALVLISSVIMPVLSLASAGPHIGAGLSVAGAVAMVIGVFRWRAAA